MFVVNCIVYFWQEETVGAVKARVKHAREENVDSLMEAARKNLAPITVNKQNLDKLLNVSDKYRHNFRKPCVKSVQNICFFVKTFNILGLNGCNNGIPAVISPGTHEFPMDSLQTLEDFDEYQCYSPTSDDHFNMFNILNNSDDEHSTHSKIQTLVEVISASPNEKSYLITGLTDYFNIPSNISPVNDPTMPKDWYSGQNFNIDFIDSFDHGVKQLRSFVQEVIKDKCLGNCARLRPKGKQHYAYIKKASQSHSEQKQTKNKFGDQAAREKIAENISSDVNVHNFDSEFSGDGISQKKVSKSSLKAFINSHFEKCSFGASDNLTKDYDFVAIDAMSLLFKVYTKQVSVQQHAKSFCSRNILPLLLKSRILIFCFDVEEHMPFLKGQERLERSVKKDPKKDVPTTARLFEEAAGCVPLPQFLTTSRKARKDYAIMIFKYIFSNPMEFFKGESDFLIIVNGLHLTDNGYSLPCYLHLNQSIESYTAGTAPALLNQIGQGDDSIFYMINEICSKGDSVCFCSEDIDIFVKSLTLLPKLKCAQTHVALFSPKCKVWETFSMNILYNVIKQQHYTLQFPVETFITIVLDLGYSDFCSGIYGLSLPKAVDIFNQNVEHDLVVGIENLQDGDIPKHVLNQMDLPHNQVIPGCLPLKEEYMRRVGHLHPSLSNLNYSEMYKALFAMKGTDSFTLPTEDGFRQHYRRVCAAFIHYSSVLQVIPNSEIVLELGFCKKHLDQDLSIGNCVFNLNNLDQRPQRRCSAVISSKGSKRKGEVCDKVIKGNGEFCAIHNKGKSKLVN